MSLTKPGQSLRHIIQVVTLSILILLTVLLFIPIHDRRPYHTPLGRSKVQVRTLVQATVVFAVNNEDRFPAIEQWPQDLVELGIIEPEQLESRVENGDGVSFIYLENPNKPFEDDNETRILVYEDPKHYEEGVVVGFADSTVEVIDHEQFFKMLSEQVAK